MELNCILFSVTFVAIFISLTTFTLILLLQPPASLAEFFELKDVFSATPEENMIRYYVLLFPLCHLMIAMIVEVSGTRISDRLLTNNNLVSLAVRDDGQTVVEEGCALVDEEDQSTE